MALTATWFRASITIRTRTMRSTRTSVIIMVTTWLVALTGPTIRLKAFSWITIRMMSFARTKTWFGSASATPVWRTRALVCYVEKQYFQTFLELECLVLLSKLGLTPRSHLRKPLLFSLKIPLFILWPYYTIEDKAGKSVKLHQRSYQRKEIAT